MIFPALHEARLFLQSLHIDLPLYQVLELYMVMGGIPFYLKEAERGKSATHLIDEICFSEQGLLSDEYEQLYHSLFRNAEFHVAVVECLAAHPQGLTRSMIAEKTNIADSTLTRTLVELVECDFISAFQPLLNKKKETIYKLTDLYSLFYLRFIRDHQGNGLRVWEQLSKEPAYKAWSGYAYENIAMMHLPQIKAALGISGVFTRHNSWKFKGDEVLPGAQIDMLIERADQVIHICEAKFTQESYALNAVGVEQWRHKKMVFREATKTKKAVFTTLITTYPAVKNRYYIEAVESEVTMEQLFAPQNSAQPWD